MTTYDNEDEYMEKTEWEEWTEEDNARRYREWNEDARDRLKSVNGFCWY